MDRDALLTTTREQFLSAFLLAVDRALPRACATLLRIAEATFSAADQRRLLGAHGLFRKDQSALVQHMRHSMDQLLNRSFQTTYSIFRPSFTDSYNTNGLTLLDTTEHEDLLRINEVTARFRHAAEGQLRDLNIRIAILFEQDRINERENPFRPFLVSRAMANAIDHLGQPTDINATLFDQLAEDMRSEIPTIYDVVNQYLAGHGIAAQLPLRIEKTPDASANGESAESASNAMNPQQFDSGTRPQSNATPRNRIEQLVDMVRQIARPFAASKDRFDQAPAGPDTAERTSAAGHANSNKGWPGTQGLVVALQKLFSGAPTPLSPAREPVDMTDPFDPSGNRAVSAPLHESLDALIADAVPLAEQMALADGDLRNLIFEQREALSAATDDSHEQMTIDVVAMLFEFILRDSQIPAEVRAQLGRLQFLVLKIALRESTLLTHKHHPARLLVNRIGSISISLQQIDPGGGRASTEISRIVDTLLSDRSDTARVFTEMLEQFDVFIAQELRGCDSPIDLAVQALEKAQSRTLRFARLSAGLAQGLSGLTIDPFLHDFLTTTWVRVIEHAERADRGIVTTAARFRQLVPDLLWSIIPKNTPAQRSKLISMLPGLVGTLREGMLQENMTGIERLAVLNWLVDVHSRALRGSDAGGPDLLLETVRLQFAAFTEKVNAVADASPAVSSIQVNGDPHHDGFLTEALQETDAALELLDPILEQDPAPTSPISNQADIDDVLGRLRSGVAIDITLGTIPGSGRLHWIDQESTTLLLQIEGHPAPSMMSVRMFLRLLGLGRVGFSEAAPLFERAVHALMLSAQQMEKTVI
ncbi:MAG: hypothetical protein ACI8WM_003503 [Burkholderiaceae bacterium]|jgi:hypothetical protein